MVRKIILGRWYRDVIHGFVGCAIAYQKHITGCDRAFIEFKGKKGHLITRDADVTTYVPVEPPDGLQERDYEPLPESDIQLGATYRCKVTGVEGIACTITERIGFDDHNIRLDRRGEDDEVQYVYVWSKDLEMIEEPSADIEALEDAIDEEKPGHVGSMLPTMI